MTGLKEIRAAGEMAAQISDAALSMNSIINQYGAKYDNLLEAVQAALGGEKTLTTMTDAEINSFFFSDVGDSQAIADTKIVITEWELNIITLRISAAKLPLNNL